MRRDVETRQGQQADAEAIADIWNQIIRTKRYSALDTPLTVEAERQYLASFPERGVFLVAADAEDQGVIGFQTLEPFAAYTHAFDHVAIVGTCVKLSLRRHGIGTQLAEVSFEEARKKGFEKLFTYIRADNEAALQFYRKLGFLTVGTAKKHAKFGAKYVDSVFLEKFL